MAALSLALWIRAAPMLTDLLQTNLNLFGLPGSPSALGVAGVVVRVILGVVVVDIGCNFS